MGRVSRCREEMERGLNLNVPNQQAKGLSLQYTLDSKRFHFNFADTRRTCNGTPRRPINTFTGTGRIVCLPQGPTKAQRYINMTLAHLG